MDENKNVAHAVAEAEKTRESESATLPLAQETVAEREEMPTLTVVPQEPAQDIPVKEDKKAAEKIEERITTSIKSNLQKTIPPPKSGYYVQVSTVKSKRNFSEIRNYVHLLDEDNLAELRKGTFYIYLVGPFSTKEDAYDKLEYYKEYSGDAFVRKL
jgi:septal ring-binding cell division protein DamX